MLTLILTFSAIGAGVGILAGLLGVGGGLVIVPILVFIFNYQGFPPEMIMHLALGTSMASIIFTSVSSFIAVTSVITAPLGAKLAHSLPVDKLKRIFSLLLIAVGTRMLLGII